MIIIALVALQKRNCHYITDCLFLLIQTSEQKSSKAGESIIDGYYDNVSLGMTIPFLLYVSRTLREPLDIENALSNMPVSVFYENGHVKMED